MAILYEKFITGDDSELGSKTTRLVGQVFTVGVQSHSVTSVKLKISKESGFVADVYAKIYGVDGSNLPDDTNVLATSAAVAASSLVTHPTTATWITFTFASPAKLAAGTKYAIVLAPEADAKNVYWRYDNGNGYADGAAAARNGTWATAHPDDCLFEVYGNMFTTSDKTYSKKLVAIANNEVWYESSDGTMIELTDANGDIDTSVPLNIFEGYGKVFIANGGNLKVADFINTKLTSDAEITTYLPSHGDILSQYQGVSGKYAYIAVDYIAAWDSSKHLIYGYAYYAGGATAFTLTHDIKNADGDTVIANGDLSVAADAAPHWYDWTVYNGSTTYGAIPNKATLGCLYRGRPTLSGNPSEPHQWHMTRQFHPWDFNYTAADVQAAVMGGNADAGEVGDIVVSLIPSKDDYLIFGCATSIWYLTGDPMAGGSLNELDLSTGMFGPQSWCWVGDTLYFWGDNGIYKTTIPGTPECISEIRLPKLVKDEAVNASTHRITMGYDHLRKGIVISITTLADGTNSNYWLDLRTSGFFPETYPEECGPYSLYYYGAVDPDYRALLVGCKDGYIRFFDDTAKDDDIGDTNEKISSYVTFGPIALGNEPGKEGSINRLSFETAEGVSDDSDDVVAKLWVSEAARSLIKKLVANANPAFSKTIVAAGRRHGDTIRRKIKGRYGGIRLENITLTKTWAFEQLLISGKSRGRFK